MQFDGSLLHTITLRLMKLASLRLGQARKVNRLKDHSALLCSLVLCTGDNRVNYAPGGKTCKVKRLKRDEAKPPYLSCTSISCLCDGYEPLAIASLPLQIPGTGEGASKLPFIPILIPTPNLWQHDVAYRTTTLLQLSLCSASNQTGLECQGLNL